MLLNHQKYAGIAEVCVVIYTRTCPGYRWVLTRHWEGLSGDASLSKWSQGPLPGIISQHLLLKTCEEKNNA